MDLKDIRYNSKTGEIEKKLDYEPTKIFMKQFIGMYLDMGYTLSSAIDKTFEFIEKLT